jgi:microcystin-dependent protein
VLAAGEPGYESDTKVLRIGDGATAFLSLPAIQAATDIALLEANNNLSDLNNASVARTNLELGTAAVADAIAFIAAEMMVGQIAYFAMTTPPSGTLKANGAAVSRATYARLFTKIGTVFGVGNGSTTFNLPDMRGEFARGWDDARGVDAGRAFGSAQADAFDSHTHTGTAASAGAHTHTLSIDGDGTGGNYDTIGSQAENSGNITTSSAGAHTHPLTVDATGGDETRPRNIALLAVIFF